MLDAIEILKTLIRFESTTPDQSGSQAYIKSLIEPYGFKTTEINVEKINNLYCEFDTGIDGPHLGFAGHTDVVPAGKLEDWTHHPFEAVIEGDHLFGRGAVDMKAGLAAFLAAGCNLATTLKKGKISFLITGDEEGDGQFGTVEILKYLDKNNIKINDCIVTEPTSSKVFGDTIKPGRRGSLHGKLTIIGKQGHTAYPEKAKNPHIDLIKVLEILQHYEFDQGYDIFLLSNLEIITIETGNKVSNIIPSETVAKFNIRFNPTFNADSLTKKLHEIISNITSDYQLETMSNAPAFLSPPTKLKKILKMEINNKCGLEPKINASGGTSDARFIQTHCPVIEFGPLNGTAHKIDECVSLTDLKNLQTIFEGVIENYFSF